MRIIISLPRWTLIIGKNIFCHNYIIIVNCYTNNVSTNKIKIFQNYQT